MADRKVDQHSLLEGLLESLITEELERRLQTPGDLEAQIDGVRRRMSRTYSLAMWPAS